MNAWSRRHVQSILTGRIGATGPIAQFSVDEVGSSNEDGTSEMVTMEAKSASKT